MKTSTRRSLPSFSLSAPHPAAPSHSGRPASSARRALRALWLIALLLLVAALLTACTRDRLIEPIATPTPSGLAPASLFSETTGGAVAAEPAPSSGEPIVQPVAVTDTTATSETIQLRADGRTIVDYTVVAGDTVGSIAIDNDTTPEEIRELNLLTDDLIQVGQVLRVPVYPPTPTPEPEPFYHTVAAGESLSGIAALYGVGQIDIITANRLADPNALVAGMRLIIPGYSPSASEGEGGEGAEGESSEPIDPAALATHTVAAGETLSKIAALYEITVAELMQTNALSDRNNVRTGTVLLIPGLTQADALKRRSVEHVVQAGESLSEIAAQYGQTVSAIMKMNLITDPNTVRTGQVLYIPPVE